MRYKDNSGIELKFFSIEKREFSTRKEFLLYNIRTGDVFFKITISKDGELVEALPFFEDIKDELYKLTMNYFIDEESFFDNKNKKSVYFKSTVSYTYDEFILPLLRNNRIKELGIT